MYEQGRRDPDTAMLKQMADLFSVSTDYLLGRSNKLAPNITPLTRLPLLGQIQAGLPVLAQEHIEEYIDVPNYLEADFILEVKGDSMIGAGILEYDYAVCRENQVANAGDIVVALHDIDSTTSEATLKFYCVSGNGPPYLRAANPKYPDIKLNGECRVVGVMVALIRRDAPSYQ